MFLSPEIILSLQRVFFQCQIPLMTLLYIGLIENKRYYKLDEFKISRSLKKTLKKNF